MNKSTIFTIGHSNKEIESLLYLLKSNKIDTLIDIRSRPYSRYNPQFNKESFSYALRINQIKYEWRGKNIGGLDTNVNESETYDELADRVKKGERIAICCSEGKPEDCHRKYDSAPALLKRGVQVAHILWDHTIKIHEEQNKMF